MPLGLDSGTVQVVPYHHDWPRLFEAEATRLRQSLSEAHLEGAIEHTGSTAVAGLAAKPVLDILVGHPAEADPLAYVEALTHAGYSNRGEQGIQGREFFRRGSPRAYHVHLTAVNGAFWTDHVKFRDSLRADDSLRDDYATLKGSLAVMYPRDREAYIAGKASFVRCVLTTQP